MRIRDPGWEKVGSGINIPDHNTDLLTLPSVAALKIYLPAPQIRKCEYGSSSGYSYIF
jgi:hypothetical protein